MFHISTGGDWTFEGIDYQRATTVNVPKTTPLVYASGSSTVVRVRDVVATGVAWTGRPIVQVASGATAWVDDTVDVVADSDLQGVRAWAFPAAKQANRHRVHPRCC